MASLLKRSSDVFRASTDHPEPMTSGASREWKGLMW